MDTIEKIKILGDAAKYDVCLSTCFGGRVRNPVDPQHSWIYPAVLSNGKIMPILKILITNMCYNNCLYCTNRLMQSKPQISFRPEELANTFMKFFHSGLVHGLFLSSGINKSANSTMEDMIKAIEIIRYKFKFNGYVHLKILPGADYSYVEKAVKLANRVSVNLESTDKNYLNEIAPKKDFENDLLKRMKWINTTIKKESSRKTQTTQFIVGATDESDYDILKRTNQLYKELNVFRTYFSAFQPVPDTPLQEKQPVPLIREHRLYQSDWLLRFYGFKFEEITFNKDGNLSLDLDPKMAWANAHPEKFPVEINTADTNELLRVPGIGLKSAERIVEQRQKNKFYTIESLKRMRVVTKRAKQFITINGKKSDNSNVIQVKFT